MKLNSRRGLISYEGSYVYLCNNIPSPSSIFANVWYTGYEKIGPAYYIERKNMPTHLLTCTLSGEGVMKYQGKTVILKKGDVSLISCNAHHVFYPADDSWEIAFLHFDGMQIQPLYEAFSKGSLPIHNDPSLSVANCIFKIHDILATLHIVEKRLITTLVDYHTGSEVHQKIEKEINSVIFALLQLIENDSEELENKTALLGKRFICENYQKKITLEEIAAAAYVSKYHFARLFKKAFGMTVLGYLSDFRFRKASVLLTYVGLSPSEAAESVGWDLQTMNVHFKKTLGMTAGEFARREKNKMSRKSES